MSLMLRIESVDYLDDGGPVSVTLTTRRLQVGRGAAMDWVLPDAQRHLSSHHFDVVFRDGAHWLEDLSTNGTFLLGQRYRLEEPHRLRAGDRFQVGAYIIAVTEAAPSAKAPPRTPAPAAVTGWTGDDDPWSIGGPLEPVDPLPPRRTGRRDDFADEYLAPPSFAPYPDESGDRADPLPFSEPAPVAQPLADPGIRPLTAAPRPDPAAIVPPGLGPDRGMDPGLGPDPVGPGAAGTFGSGPAPQDIIAAFCEGAGLDPAGYRDADPLAMVREAGAALRGMTDQTMTHLRARAAFRQALRGQVERTMAGIDVNPLKTAPHPARALEEVFFRPRAGTVTGARAMEAAARDLAQHHAALIAALQPALGAVLHDLAPEAVEAAAGGGLLGGGRKGKAWDAFVERWDGKAAAHENGMLDEFFVHLAKAYADALRVAGDGAGDKAQGD